MVVSDNVLKVFNQPLKQHLRKLYALSFKLVGEDEISIPKKGFVFGNLVFRDVELPIVAHDRVQHCPLSVNPFLSTAARCARHQELR